MKKKHENRKVINGRLPARYSKMTATNLDAETTQFDQEFIANRSVPLTRELQSRLRHARRKRGRPRIGKGAQRVLVTIERNLLKQSDAFAKRKKISRAQLIAQGLQAVLAQG